LPEQGAESAEFLAKAKNKFILIAVALLIILIQ